MSGPLTLSFPRQPNTLGGLSTTAAAGLHEVQRPPCPTVPSPNSRHLVTSSRPDRSVFGHEGLSIAAFLQGHYTRYTTTRHRIRVNAPTKASLWFGPGDADHPRFDSASLPMSRRRIHPSRCLHNIKNARARSSCSCGPITRLQVSGPARLPPCTMRHAVAARRTTSLILSLYVRSVGYRRQTHAETW